jgi:hypothetical protein
VRIVDLNEYLSVENEWTQRLLGLEPYQQRRTLELVERSYNVEHYGRLLREYRDDVEALRKKFLHPSDQEVAFSLEDSVFSAPLSQFVSIRRSYMRRTLDGYANGALLCELGAGFGQNFVWLERDVYGGEYSESAVALAGLLGFDIRPFNFYEPETYEFIRPGTVVFTSHAIEQVPDASTVVKSLKGLRDRIGAVVHFEPLYHRDRRTLLGLLRNSYTQINDYNLNLLECLEGDPDIEILSLEEDVFGINPLNPTSILVWRFA